MSKYHADLVAEIDAFLEQKGMSSTTFGRQGVGDPHFLRDIRATRLLRPETVSKVREFMANYSPSADTDKVEWPVPSSGKSGDFADQAGRAA